MVRQLSDIKSPADVKQFDENELPYLCKEIRAMIVDVMSTNSGHLGASLGAVELAVGIHYAFDISRDSLVWDVGHQAYAHKILTGRMEAFQSIRRFKGLSGFPSRKESGADHFGTGHSSTSISAVLGMAIARKLKGEVGTNVAVIGDGSLTGGMAFEGLNHLATEKVNAIIIVNDNDMSIDPNVGGLQKHLNSIDPDDNIFTHLGLNYHGVYNGNDMQEVVQVLKNDALKTGVHIVHFKTKKGFGYKYSEDGNPTHWHAPGKFEVGSGVGAPGSPNYPKKYQHIVGETLLGEMQKDEDIVVVSPAMATGSSLKEIERLFPERFFDVGIAEQHAVTFSAGLSTQGKKAVCVVYSTFLQRGYDQLIHDVALQNLPVTFLIDRAGLVGRDGATHHGMFDLAYLNAIPNMTLFAPQNENQLAALIRQTGELSAGPVAIRYPRGKGVLTEPVDVSFAHKDYDLISAGKSRNLVITIGAVGNKVTPGELYDVLSLIKVKPLNVERIKEIITNYEKLVFVEDGVANGGIAKTLASQFAELGVQLPFRIIAFPDNFIGHGGQNELYAAIEMDAANLNRRLHDFFID